MVKEASSHKRRTVFQEISFSSLNHFLCSGTALVVSLMVFPFSSTVLYPILANPINFDFPRVDNSVFFYFFQPCFGFFLISAMVNAQMRIFLMKLTIKQFCEVVVIGKLVGNNTNTIVESWILVSIPENR